MQLQTENRLPLIYFFGITPGKYMVAWPVYVVHDQPDIFSFTVAVDDADYMSRPLIGSSGAWEVHDSAEDVRRQYVTTVVRRRVHQRAFRERVLDAYRRKCSFCRFRHDELLNAVHITEDSDERGDPVISNGLALCKLHHAALDRGFVGVRPDRVIEVRSDLLGETDGPTLVHGIQRLHGTEIRIPRRQDLQPAVERLQLRYERFLQSGRAA